MKDTRHLVETSIKFSKGQGRWPEGKSDFPTWTETINVENSNGHNEDKA